MRKTTAPTTGGGNRCRYPTGTAPDQTGSYRAFDARPDIVQAAIRGGSKIPKPLGDAHIIVQENAPLWQIKNLMEKLDISPRRCRFPRYPRGGSDGKLPHSSRRRSVPARSVWRTRRFQRETTLWE